MINLKHTKVFNLIINKTIHMTSKNEEATGSGPKFGIASCLALIA